jgi:hypothetical protein
MKKDEEDEHEGWFGCAVVLSSVLALAAHLCHILCLRSIYIKMMMMMIDNVML